MADNESCGLCKCFFPIQLNKAVGTCHFNPPTDRQWPIVRKDEWCNQFSKGNASWQVTVKQGEEVDLTEDQKS